MPVSEALLFQQRAQAWSGMRMLLFSATQYKNKSAALRSHVHDQGGTHDIDTQGNVEDEV
jgi:hypothetical protein